MIGEPITPGQGAEIVRILEAREGQATTVQLVTGERLEVSNIAWGRDMGEDWEHISTNISPTLPGTSFDFFLTSEVAKVADPATGETLYARLAETGL